MSSRLGLIERTLEAMYQALRLAGPTSLQGSRGAADHTVPDLLQENLGRFTGWALVWALLLKRPDSERSELQDAP